MWTGALLGALSSWWWWSRVPTSLTGWVGLHLLLIGPTALQPWLQVKAYKVLARTLLGVGSATWLLGLFSHRTPLPWALEAALAGAFFMASLKLLLWVRERKATSPCLSCPLGVYPTCEWNLPRLLAEADDSSALEGLRQGILSGQIESR